MGHLADAGFGRFKISVVMTRHNVAQLDALARAGRPLRRPAAAHPPAPVGPGGRHLGRTCTRRPNSSGTCIAGCVDRPDVLTGDSFFHLSALGEPLEGLNLCGAGRVVCLIDPVGDVYACPFVIHPEFLAGNVRAPGGFTPVWRESSLFAGLREPQSAGACASCGSYDACRGGCMAAKFFTGLPARRSRPRVRLRPRRGGAGRRRRPWPCPRPGADHSKPAQGTAPVRLAPPTRRPVHA